MISDLEKKNFERKKSGRERRREGKEMMKKRIVDLEHQLAAAISANEKGSQEQLASHISACVKSSQWSMSPEAPSFHPASEMGSQMGVAAFSLDDISFNTAISACEKDIQLEPAFSLSLNAAIPAYETGSLVDIATSALEVQPSEDFISFNAAISACEKGNQWDSAFSDSNSSTATVIEQQRQLIEQQLQLQQQLQQFIDIRLPQVKPSRDDIRFSAAISARERDLQQQVELMKSIIVDQQKEIERLELISCNAAISAGESSDKLDGAASLNVISFNSAISACGKGIQHDADCQTDIIISPAAENRFYTIQNSQHGNCNSPSVDVISFNAITSPGAKGSAGTVAITASEKGSHDGASAESSGDVINFNASSSTCEQGTLGSCHDGTSAESSGNVISFNASSSTCEQGTLGSAITASEKGSYDGTSAESFGDVISFNASSSTCEQGQLGTSVVVEKLYNSTSADTSACEQGSHARRLSAYLTACEKGSTLEADSAAGHSQTASARVSKWADEDSSDDDAATSAYEKGSMGSSIGSNAAISAFEKDSQLEQGIALGPSVTASLISACAKDSNSEERSHCDFSSAATTACEKGLLRADVISSNAAISSCEVASLKSRLRPDEHYYLWLSKNHRSAFAQLAASDITDKHAAIIALSLEKGYVPERDLDGLLADMAAE